MFRGREITLRTRAEDILARIAAEVEEIATVEQMPKFEGRTMIMVLSPK
jgi:translation initiation factor IF-3